MNYQTDFLCTYKLMDTEDEQEQLYRIQLLQAFDLPHWDDDKINSTILTLYRLVAKTDEFAKVFEKALANQNMQMLLLKFGDDINTNEDNLFLIFTFLFNFTYFDLLHRCLCEYLRRKSIAPAILNKLLISL
jgi:hypothetical protein